MDCECADDQPMSLRMAPALCLKDPEQMECVELVGHRSDYDPVQPLCRCNLARLVGCKRPLQDLPGT